MIKFKPNIGVSTQFKEIQINISILPVLDINIFSSCMCIHLGWLVFYLDIWIGDLSGLIL